VVLVAVAAVIGGTNFFGKAFSKGHADLVLFPVRYDSLPLTIVERGTLESQNNNDIVCRVKARAQGSNVASTIKWIVDDGSHVLHDRPLKEIQYVYEWNEKEARYDEKILEGSGWGRVVKIKDSEGTVHHADLLVDLDDSGLQDNLKTQRIAVDKAESDKIQAEEKYKIDVSQNESDIATAENNLKIAELNLQKYLEGDYPQSLKDVLGRRKVAESDVEQQRERVQWMERMVKKGYQTTSQAQAEQSRLESLELNLQKIIEEQRVLTIYTREVQETDLKGKVAEAKRTLDRTKSQALAKEAQSRTDRDSKKRVWMQESDRYKDLVEEIRKTKLWAPQDGLVVYYVSEQGRFGMGRQAVVAQGEQVTEGQKLMQIPDLKRMAITAKVHEALVSRVKSGQKAVVRCDSFPDRVLGAHVDQVATVAAQTDWWASDVKVYNTKVAIDEFLEGLKPGMSAEVTITTGATREHVLTIPVQAVLGGAEMAGQRQVFVLGNNGPEKRNIVIGESNDKNVEVKEGLQEGDQVVLNPKALIGEEKVKTRDGKENGKNGKGGEESGKGDQKGPAAKGGPGGPGAGKAGPGGPGGAGGPGSPGGAGGAKGKMDQESMKKMVQEFDAKMKKASPEERKKLLQQVPEAYRDITKQRLKGQGIDVPD
jgi:RND family efflux transporter MFP subunit